MKECKKTGKYQLLFSFYEKLAAVLADKADLGMCIKSYDRSDRAALKDISQNVIPGIICNLTDMKSSREKSGMNSHLVMRNQKVWKSWKRERLFKGIKGELMEGFGFILLE